MAKVVGAGGPESLKRCMRALLRVACPSVLTAAASVQQPRPLCLPHLMPCGHDFVFATVTHSSLDPHLLSPRLFRLVRDTRCLQQDPDGANASLSVRNSILRTVQDIAIVKARRGGLRELWGAPLPCRPYLRSITTPCHVLGQRRSRRARSAPAKRPLLRYGSPSPWTSSSGALRRHCMGRPLVSNC